jgi:ABC-type sugar transport system substrate-binding protein
MMAKYALDEAKKVTPNLTYVVKPAQYLPTKQGEIIQEAIYSGYDGIIAEIMDPNSSKAPIEEAEAAGIPVITVNLNSNAVHTLHIESNDSLGGQQAAEILASSVGGTGNALTVNGPAAQKGTNKMIKGFNDKCKASYPNIKILADLPSEGWMADEAQLNVSNALIKYPNIDIIYAASDDLANGAILAITKAGRQDDIKVYGSGGYPDALNRIKDGTQFGTSFADGYAEYQTAVSKMAEALQSGQTAKSLNLTSTPVLQLDTVPVTKDGANGSTKVDTIITDSHWDVVLPDAFK